MEHDVDSGKLHGSMWGIRDRNDPDEILAASSSGTTAGGHLMAAELSVEGAAKEEEQPVAVSRRMLH